LFARFAGDGSHAECLAVVAAIRLSLDPLSQLLH
jgi:hypothetical protein